MDVHRFLRRPSSLLALFVAVLTCYHLLNDIRIRNGSMTSTFAWTAVDKRPSASTEMPLFDQPSGPVKDVESLFDQFHAEIAELELQKPNYKAFHRSESPPQPRSNFMPKVPPKVAPSDATNLDDSLPAPPPPSFNFTIDESDGCTPETEPHPNATAVFSDYPREISMEHLMEVMQAGVNPGDQSYSRRRIAMCKLRRYGNYAHFPHMMQQFTRCFSFWMIYGSYEPYLYMYTHIHAYRRGHDEFNQGMFRLFRQVFNVKIVFDFKNVDQNTLLVKPLYDVSMDESLEQGIVFQNEQHAAVLRDSALDYYNITAEGCKSGKVEPVIRIIDREPNSTRTIVNVKKLQKYLRKLTSHPVQIYTFENRTFKQQIEKMAQTDILVTPHGAQLSSLSFMPPCGGVFEIFPEGYYLPYFYGPLAATSGIRHAYVYNGADVKKEWYKGNKIDRPGRLAARRQDVCVPLQTSVEMIAHMVDEWKVCCQQRTAQGLVT